MREPTTSIYTILRIKPQNNWSQSIYICPQDYNDDIRQEQMWEMQILNTQGRDGGGAQGVEAPLSPASSLEAANSPTAATTANSIDGQEDGATRPTPSPPHPACLKSQGTVLPAVTSNLGN